MTDPDDPYLKAPVVPAERFPTCSDLFLVDPVKDYEAYKRLGVELVPSKTSELGQQAMQLDMFKK